ncbi:MAG: 2-dehydro-3-deoxy-L-rhamnonate dehydrogenase [Burkholderiales bacterium]|jgi:NAD(P)-dependent dehydrogenase (short-subunit alcohol dehydrogenase family)
MNQLDLNGRAAIVTGGASGIGLAIARRLGISGAALGLWDVNDVALAQAVHSLGKPEIHTFSVDISSQEQVETAFAAALDVLGKIDVLVNSAGISGPNAPTWEYPVDAWSKVLQVNLTGTFLACRVAVPHMIGNGYGRIVNIASVAGKEGNPNAPACSASEAGVIGLTKTLGKELAKTGVNVNCVTPGAVNTAILGQMTPRHIDDMLSKVPMGRLGEVDEIAALAGWLCTEECSFSTGAVFDLSGGRAMY